MTVRSLAPPRRWLRRYAGFSRIQFQTVLAYRADYLVTAVVLLLQVYLLKVVWTALYADRGSVDGVPLDTMIAYATLATLQYTVINRWRFSPIPERVRRGWIATDLLRPAGFVGQMLALQLGGTAAIAPFVLLAAPFALVVGGAAAPAGPTALLAYLVSLALAYLVSQQLALLLGLVSFWTLEVGGVYLMYRVVAQFLSGALIPLWFMPDPVRIVAAVLPFQATLYTPTAVYLGQLAGSSALRALAVQLAWGGGLALLTRLVWWRAIRRVVVQGG